MHNRVIADFNEVRYAIECTRLSRYRKQETCRFIGYCCWLIKRQLSRVPPTAFSWQLRRSTWSWVTPSEWPWRSRSKCLTCWSRSKWSPTLADRLRSSQSYERTSDCPSCVSRCYWYLRILEAHLFRHFLRHQPCIYRFGSIIWLLWRLADHTFCTRQGSALAQMTH